MQKKRIFKGAFTCRWAPSDGADGKDGEPGKDGTGIKSADVVFCVTESNTTEPSDNLIWYTTFSQLTMKENTYVWSCTKITLTDGTTKYTGKQCLGASKDFVTITEQYAVGSSPTTAPTSGWGTTYTPTKELWLWTRNRMEWKNSTITTFTYSTPICIGYFAKDGDPGKDGAYTTYDFALSAQAKTSSGNTSPSDIYTSEWAAVPPTPTSSKPYVWMRIQRFNGTSTTATSTTYTRVTGEAGQPGDDGAYTIYDFNISKNNTSTSSSQAPANCYYSTWQDAPMATTDTYPYLWMRMQRKNDPDDDSVLYICMTGEKGQPGNPGSDGNGISSQTSYFIATDKKSVTSYSSVSGWSTTFPTPNDQKPYVWKCVKTIYTKSGTSYSTPELVTTYHSGDNGNILENVSFTDADNMGAWNVKSQYQPLSGKTAPQDLGSIDSSNKKDGRNSYHDTCKATGATITCKEMLRQKVHHPAGGVQKLAAGQWYTLSFWAKGRTKPIVINETSSNYGFATKELYLIAGRTYTIRVIGKCDSTAVANGKELRTYINATDWSEGNSCATKSTSVTAMSMTFTPQKTGAYRISSYQYDNTEPRTGKVTVQQYEITDQVDLVTYIYPTAVDTSTKMIVDGIEVTTPSDLGYSWKLTDEWTRHSVTFKTKQNLTTEEQNCLFRLMPAINEEGYREAWICMPKLESGMFATGFIDGIDDLRGIPGLIERTSEWSAGTEYHNDESLTGGIRYLDIVTVTDNTTGNFSMYQCRVTHTSTAANAPNGADSNEWLKLNQMRPIYTPLIVAKNAVLRFSQTNRILITNSKQQVQGCFGGVEDETNGYPLWIGGTTAAAAKFKVKYGGQLEATEASITGTINAVSGQFGSDFTDEDGNYYPNFKINGYALQSGIRGKTGWMELTNQALTFGSKEANGIWGHFGRNVLPIPGLGTYGNSVLAITITTPSSFGNEVGAANFGAVIDVRGQAKNENYAISGSHALYIPNGDIAGFRFNTRNISWNTEIDNMDNLIHCINSSEITLKLPTSPKRGHFLMIWQEGAKVNFDAGNYKIYGYPGSRGSTTFNSNTYGQLNFFTFNGYHWMMRFINK